MKKNNNVEFWRFIFTVIVCLLHFCGTYYSGLPYFSGGFISVEFFYILSGFLLMASQTKSELKPDGKISAAKYTFGKLKSIYPHYIFSFVVIFVYVMIDSKMSLLSTSKILLNSLWEISMLQMSGIRCSIYNQPTWYLSGLIMMGYLIYYLLNHHRRIFLEVIAPISILFIYAFFSIKISHVNAWIDESMYMKVGIFRAFAGMSLGCICYVAYSKLNDYPLSKKMSNLLDVIGVACLTFVAVRTNMANSPEDSFAFIFLLAIGVTIAFLDKGFIKSLLNNKLSGYLGKITYPMYLNHIFIMSVFIKVLPNRGLKVIPVYMAVVAIYSVITSIIVRLIGSLFSRAFKALNS